jgi:alpha-tubulin suppressor-like RCC1 family protein
MGNALPAVNLGTGLRALAVRAGGRHACAIVTGRKVKCWGNNADGQLGTGDAASRGATSSSMGDNLPFVDLGTNRTAKELAVGMFHSCAILDDNRVKCWGSGQSGALGLGNTASHGTTATSMGDNLPAVSLGSGRTAKSISVGTRFSCAILDDMQLKCWGWNVSGQLGQGDTAARGDGPGEMGDALFPVNLGPGRTAKWVSAGADFVCATLDDTQLKCWGNNAWGQLGQGHTLSIGDNPNEMALLAGISLGTSRRALNVSAAGQAACALLDDSSLKCWGAGFSGQLGLGDFDHRGDGANEMGNALPTVSLGGGLRAWAVSKGTDSTCVLLSTRQLKCWGNNALGQLGTATGTEPLGDEAGEMADALPFVNLGFAEVKSFSVGDDSTCAILNGDKLKCWGSNGIGQLGLGAFGSRGDQPGEMGDALPFVNVGSSLTVKQISTRFFTSCALLNDGRIKCWGSNSTLDFASGEHVIGGQLGRPDVWFIGNFANEMGDALPYVDLGTNLKATKVEVGSDFVCAILESGKVKCWGNNEEGELGAGHTRRLGNDPGEMGDNLPYVPLPAGRTALALSSGRRHTCALLDNHDVVCWGFNMVGQLGLGDVDNRGDDRFDVLRPVQLAHDGVFRTAVAVAAGSFHTCAILDNGQVKCWGSNDKGQLGAGNTLIYGDNIGEMGNGLPNIDLGPGETAKAITAGFDSTCVLLNSGRVKCWGSNANGLLGIGDVRHRGDQANEMGSNLPAVFLGPGRTATAVGMSTHACARLDTGELKCWGSNGSGQLGQGHQQSLGITPAQAGAGYPTVELGSGAR